MATSDDLDEFGNPSQGEHYQQNFDAPFFPSVNLESTVQSIHKGWAVVAPAANTKNDSKLEKRNDIISPSLMNAAHISNHRESSNDREPTQVEDGEQMAVAPPKFDLDNFQPELQSGFKPIYPSNAPQTLDQSHGVQQKSAPKNDDSIEALIYDDSGTESESDEENDTEKNEMTTSS